MNERGVPVADRMCQGLPTFEVRLGSCVVILGFCLWWVHQDSNLGPAGYEPVALTAELWTRERESSRLWRGGPGLVTRNQKPDVRLLPSDVLFLVSYLVG